MTAYVSGKWTPLLLIHLQHTTETGTAGRCSLAGTLWTTRRAIEGSGYVLPVSAKQWYKQRTVTSQIRSSRPYICDEAFNCCFACSAQHTSCWIRHSVQMHSISLFWNIVLKTGQSRGPRVYRCDEIWFCLPRYTYTCSLSLCQTLYTKRVKSPRETSSKTRERINSTFSRRLRSWCGDFNISLYMWCEFSDADTKSFSQHIHVTRTSLIRPHAFTIILHSYTVINIRSSCLLIVPLSESM